MTFSVVDLVAAVIIIFGAFAGLRAGMVKSLASIAALIIATIAAFLLYQPISLIFESLIDGDVGPWVRVITFVVLFILVNWLVNLAGEWLHKMMKFLYLAPLNRILGFVIGAAFAFIAISLLIVVLANFEGLIPTLNDSWIGHFVMVEWGLPDLLLSEEMEQQIDDLRNTLPDLQT